LTARGSFLSFLLKFIYIVVNRIGGLFVVFHFLDAIRELGDSIKKQRPERFDNSSISQSADISAGDESFLCPWPNWRRGGGCLLTNAAGHAVATAGQRDRPDGRNTGHRGGNGYCTTDLA
jgi:hypothetical protein